MELHRSLDGTFQTRRVIIACVQVCLFNCAPDIIRRLTGKLHLERKVTPEDNPHDIPHWAKFKVLAYVAPKGALLALGLKRRESVCSEEAIRAVHGGLEDPNRRDAWIRCLEVDAMEELEKISGFATRFYNVGYRGPNTEPEELVAFCSTSQADEYGQRDPRFWVENAKPEEKVPELLRVGAMLGYSTSDGRTAKPQWYIPDEACNEHMRASTSLRNCAPYIIVRRRLTSSI
jgi:hypothetical protein